MLEHKSVFTISLPFSGLWLLVMSFRIPYSSLQIEVAEGAVVGPALAAKICSYGCVNELCSAIKDNNSH